MLPCPEWLEWVFMFIIVGLCLIILPLIAEWSDRKIKEQQKELDEILKNERKRNYQ